MAERGTRAHWDANVQAGRQGTWVHSDHKDVTAYALGQSQGGTGYTIGTSTISGPSVSGSPGGIGALIFLPPLLPPLIALYGVWVYLDDGGWGIWSKIGAVVAAAWLIYALQNSSFDLSRPKLLLFSLRPIWVSHTLQLLIGWILHQAGQVLFSSFLGLSDIGWEADCPRVI